MSVTVVADLPELHVCFFAHSGHFGPGAAVGTVGSKLSFAASWVKVSFEISWRSDDDQQTIEYSCRASLKVGLLATSARRLANPAVIVTLRPCRAPRSGIKVMSWINSQR